MKRIAPAAAGLAALFAAGCIPSFSLKTGQPIGDNQVRAIAPGATTKSELFALFGAPAAIAARGEVVSVAAPATRVVSYRPGSTYSFDADTLYELFPVAPEPEDYRRVYYYRHVVNDKINFFMLLALYERGTTTADALWVLVNEKTGIVEDYAFRKSGSPVVFGKPRGGGPR